MMFWKKKKEPKDTLELLKNHRKCLEDLDITTRTQRAAIFTLVDLLVENGIIDEAVFLERFYKRCKILDDLDWLYRAGKELEEKK